MRATKYSLAIVVVLADIIVVMTALSATQDNIWFMAVNCALVSVASFKLALDLFTGKD